MKQNITLALDRSLVRRARMLAAERSTSVSQLVAQELTRLVERAERRERARRRALKNLETGFRLGGKPAPRAVLHER